MSTVVLDISISLDGYITADTQSPEQPLGEGGAQLHDWIDDEIGSQLLAEATANLGAAIAGRTTYDSSLPWWGADGPTGPARCPVFVVTHEQPSDPPADGVYTFVTDGIESALDQATATAGAETVSVMGGASICQQFLAAG
ncbi:dihydrofolate reductase family protein [Halocatena halophila]|uniref:dihydrofolate reductase family protein n=1 Tax=Halocatena halophila TaxID=2814576 RepID=UPI002ED5EEA3